MNTSSLLSPVLLHAVTVFLVSLALFLVAVHTGMFAVAAGRAGLPPRTRKIAPLIVAALLAAWAGWAIVAVTNPVVVPEPAPLGNRPMVLFKMLVMLATGVSLIFASKTLRAVNAATPPAWLIAVQTYRVAGVMFLWPFLAAGALPAGFALPAGIGDALTGLAAPFVGWPSRAIGRGRGPERWLGTGLVCWISSSPSPLRF